jgi:hypothetical protein
MCSFKGSVPIVVLFAAMFCIAGCSSAPKGSAPAGSGDAPLDVSRVHPPQGMPRDAAQLLAKGAVDSCSVCAKNFRKRAFEILEKRFPPGTIVRSDSASWFMRVAPNINQLILASDLEGDPTLTFRFHTPADHLVGIAESDWSDEDVANRCHSAPEGVVFRGALQVVPFRYGDGAGFLYHASTNSIELQCKVLSLDWY